ncbi:hypothetical protein [Ulvibacter antarcticus]|uniref:Glycerophosphoryl diester phosphodiesterase family protein n=1 Tax=Ulvibacter antarcticus TaxID=442714 RepID=A0A3L9ZII5_9FLAO|nr:hypothetical protein [Ulvibacter antarcticus]RMA66532.1 hypothetical protein BXY75_0958 [Ulvibacter antarcticus]
MQKDIFQKIEEAKKPDFGDILSRSFEFFKLVWKEGLKHVLVTIVVLIPAILLIYVPYIIFFISAGAFDSPGSYDNVEPDFVRYIPLLILYFLLVFVIMFFAQTVAFAITAHFYKVCKKVDTGESFETEGYFEYLKGGNFKKIFLLALASFGIAIGAALLCYLPLFYVMVPLQLLVVIHAFNKDLSVSDIIKAGFKLGNRFWIIIFGLVMISSIIAQVGILLCFVGVFVTAYFVHIPIYFVYKDTIGFDDEIDLDPLLMSV